mmetsp:Transcript_26345/g.69273  ORF Transcript_26345/g.69273 Transcript_26345/m.69273 type:complete len:206 (-) Transcript_26345:627-1244(-)
MCVRDACLLSVGLLVASSPRVHIAGYVVALFVRGVLGWIHICSVLQDMERRGLEDNDSVDSVLVPWICVLHFLHLGPVHLGNEFLRSRPLCHDVRDPCSLVRHLCTLGVPWCFSRVQEGAHQPASSHESDPEADPCSTFSLWVLVHLHCGRHLAFRCSVHRTLFPDVFDLAASVLLPLRFLDVGDFDSDSDLCRDLHRTGLLPVI